MINFPLLTFLSNGEEKISLIFQLQFLHYFHFPPSLLLHNFTDELDLPFFIVSKGLLTHVSI